MLSHKQILQYKEDGFLVPNYKLSSSTIEAIRKDVDELIGEDPDRHQFVPTILDYHPKFIQYAKDPNLLDMIEQLAGPDFVLWNISLFGKPARHGKKVPWHQDGEYWPIRPMATTRIWIALDRATRKNGCLRYLRGSHRAKKIFKHHETTETSLLLQYGIDKTEIQSEKIFDLEIEPGQMGIHDIFMVHGSEPNVTPERRRAIVLNFMPTTSYFDHNLAAKQYSEMDIDFDHSKRPLYLMRGIDRCGKNNFKIGKIFEKKDTNS